MAICFYTFVRILTASCEVPGAEQNSSRDVCPLLKEARRDVKVRIAARRTLGKQSAFTFSLPLRHYETHYINNLSADGLPVDRDVYRFVAVFARAILLENVRMIMDPLVSRSPTSLFSATT